MAVSRSRCLDPHTRINQLQAAVDEIGAGASILVSDEGVDLGGPFTRLDFIGATVAAADAGSNVASVTISGGAGTQNLFETVSLSQTGGGSAAGDATLVAETTTDTLFVDAGAHIEITGTASTDTLRIALWELYTFFTITVAGQDTVNATTSQDNLTLVAGNGFVIETDNATRTITLSVATDIGGFLDEGFAIDITGSEIAVDLADTNPCLEDDGAGDIRLKVKSTGGLERTSDGVQDKWRYHLIKGLAKGAHTPSVTGVLMDNVESVHGESPVALAADEINCPEGLPLYASDNEVVYAKFNNVNGIDETDSWTTDTMANLRPIMAGFTSYDPTKNLVLVHNANATTGGQEQMAWKERTNKVIWGLDPDGGHTITTSGTTLTLTLKVTKYTFDAVNLTAETDADVVVTYSGTDCS